MSSSFLCDNLQHKYESRTMLKSHLNSLYRVLCSKLKYKSPNELQIEHFVLVSFGSFH